VAAWCTARAGFKERLGIGYVHNGEIGMALRERRWREQENHADCCGGSNATSLGHERLVRKSAGPADIKQEVERDVTPSLPSWRWKGRSNASPAPWQRPTGPLIAAPRGGVYGPSGTLGRKERVYSAGRGRCAERRAKKCPIVGIGRRPSTGRFFLGMYPAFPLSCPVRNCHGSTPTAPPQIRTCPIKASGSSRYGLAA